MSENKSYNSVVAFHQAFGHPIGSIPTVIEPELAIKRAIWTAEELVEFIHASVAGESGAFLKALTAFIDGIDDAVKKQLAVGPIAPEDVLTAQMDALTDISYFNYGSYAVAGVDPQPLFDIVQDANMGKLWEDGKPRYREGDRKILKPDGWEENFAPEKRLKEEINRQINEKA